MIVRVMVCDKNDCVQDAEYMTGEECPNCQEGHLQPMMLVPETEGDNKFGGQLEVDYNRGVIYFHGTMGMTLLRICGLPTPIINPAIVGMLDITVTDNRKVTPTLEETKQVILFSWTRR